MATGGTWRGPGLGDVLLLLVVAAIEVWLGVVLVLNASDELSFTQHSHRVVGQVREVDVSRQGQPEGMLVSYRADDGQMREGWVRVRDVLGPNTPPAIGSPITVAYADDEPQAVRLPGFGGTTTASLAFAGWSLASGLTWWLWRWWSRSSRRTRSPAEPALEGSDEP